MASIESLAGMLEGANNRATTALDCISEWVEELPSQLELKNYFEKLNSDYKRWLQADIAQTISTKRLKQQRRDEYARSIKLEAHEMDCQDVEGTALLGKHDLSPDMPGTSTQLNPTSFSDLEAGLGELTSEARMTEVEALDLELQEMEQHLNNLQDRLQIPQLRLAKADDDKRSLGFKLLPDRIHQDYLSSKARISERHFTQDGTQEGTGIMNHNIHTINVDLACVLLFLRNATGRASEGTYLFESFLELKYREDHSQHIKELQALSRQLHRLKKFEFAADGLSDESTTESSKRSCGSRICIPDTWCFDVWGCFRRDTVKPEFESCRSYVKFHITFQTTIIAIAQVVYAVLMYLNHEGDIAHGLLGIPLGFMVLGIQAIILIPCYTKTDATKAKQITLNLLSNYSENVGRIEPQIAGLAQQEKFMEELESIRKDTRSATQKVKAFDTDFARAFELVMAIYTSLRKSESEQYTIKSEVDETDQTLLLVRRAIHHAPIPRASGSSAILPAAMDDLEGHSNVATSDLTSWKHELNRAQRQMADSGQEVTILGKAMALLKEREQIAANTSRKLEDIGSQHRTADENKAYRAAWNEKEECREKIAECIRDLEAAQKAGKAASARAEKASRKLGKKQSANPAAVQATARSDTNQDSYQMPLSKFNPSRRSDAADANESVLSPLVQEKNRTYGSGPSHIE